MLPQFCRQTKRAPSQLRLYSGTSFTHIHEFRNPKSVKLLASIGGTSLPYLRGLPEAIVTGRANTGKSSLLNAILMRNNLLYTGKKAGRTVTMNFFRVGYDPGKLILVDAPGYGERGRPEWGHSFDFYVNHRKELRRVYVLLNGKHEINEADLAMLRALDQKCQESSGLELSLQAVITKVDAIQVKDATARIQAMRQQIFDAAPLCLPPILTSTAKTLVGIEEMRQSIAEACAT